MINWGITFSRVYGDDSSPVGKEKKLALTCPYCGTHTDAEIVARFTTEGNDFIKLPTYEMKVYNFFLRCTRCEGAILVLWSYAEEMIQSGGTTAGRMIFPFYTEAFESKDFPEDVVPRAILEDVVQAELSYYVNAHLGAGLLLRRACQNICRHKECDEKGGLLSQIKELVTKNIITTDLGEMADAVRIIGNEIAHPSPNDPFVITPADIKVAQEFVRQLIQAVYINPHRAKVMKMKLKEKGVE